MRARESGLWAWLNIKILGLHMHRIENVLERGTPDVEGCFREHAFWCELKSVPRRQFPAPVWCELKAEQARFLGQRVASGGRAWVLTRPVLVAALDRADGRSGESR